MGRYFKYSEGDYINGVKLLRRLDKRHNCWYGLFECPYCGEKFEAQIGHIQCGQTRSCGCIPVGAKSERYPRENLVKDIVGQRFGKLIALEKIGAKPEYKSRSCYWKCQCDCGNIIEVSMNALNRGQKSCGKCPREYTPEDISQQKFGLLTVLEYVDRDERGPIWKCLCECGNFINVHTHDLKTENVKSCGCINSYGEKLIAHILDDLKIKYKKQKTFKTCINPQTNTRLRFDFYLPDHNCCIEYDGAQHFSYKENAKSWNNREQYEKTIYCDKLKNKWCENNEIKLIRIPYTEQKKISPEYLLAKIEGEELI